jgi:hypothetical protein
MIRGVFAEAAFAADVLPQPGGVSSDSWRPPYDFLLTDQPAELDLCQQ